MPLPGTWSSGAREESARLAARKAGAVHVPLLGGRTSLISGSVIFTVLLLLLRVRASALGLVRPCLCRRRLFLCAAAGWGAPDATAVEFSAPAYPCGSAPAALPGPVAAAATIARPSSTRTPRHCSLPRETNPSELGLRACDFPLTHGRVRCHPRADPLDLRAMLNSGLCTMFIVKETMVEAVDGDMGVIHC